MLKKIGLLNWSGHRNLGDDAMAIAFEQALEKRFYEVINQGERPNSDEVDAYIWGGGTLISSAGCWPRLPDGKHIVGFGIGISEVNPPIMEECLPDLLKCKMIFARDIYTYIILAKYGVPVTLSYDPVFLLDYQRKKRKRDIVAVNFIDSPLASKDEFAEVLRFYDLSGLKVEGYAIGHPQDEQGLEYFGIPYKFYDNPFELLNFLESAKATIATRLHATVLSYMAGVPEINSIVYDRKITRFKEYVMDNKIEPFYMNQMLNKHLNYACDLLSGL